MAEPTRTVSEIKKKWQTYSSHVRGKVAKEKRTIRKTGGGRASDDENDNDEDDDAEQNSTDGEPEIQTNSAVEANVIDVITRVSVEGLKGGFEIAGAVEKRGATSALAIVPTTSKSVQSISDDDDDLVMPEKSTKTTSAVKAEPLHTSKSRSLNDLERSKSVNRIQLNEDALENELKKLEGDRLECTSEILQTLKDMLQVQRDLLKYKQDKLRFARGKTRQSQPTYFELTGAPAQLSEAAAVPGAADANAFSLLQTLSS